MISCVPLLLSAHLANAASSYVVCEYNPPPPIRCVVHFDENSVELSQTAIQDLRLCMATLGGDYSHISGMGHADACEITVEDARSEIIRSLGVDLIVEGDKWVPADGNELLSWGRVLAVQQLLNKWGGRNLRYGWAKVTGDDLSTGHEADDRTVVIEAPGVCKTIAVIDGSGSMSGNWRAIVADPAIQEPGTCVRLIKARNGVPCPADWKDPKTPFGDTPILDYLSVMVDSADPAAKIRVYSDFGQGYSNFRELRKKLEDRQVCVVPRYVSLPNLNPAPLKPYPNFCGNH